MINKIHSSTLGALSANSRKGTWETLCFLGHRLSGIALTVYLVAHIFMVSPLLNPVITFNDRMEFMHSPVVFALELLLFAAVVAHMLNGARLMLGDFLGLTKEQKSIFNVIVIIGIVVFFIGGGIMTLNFLKLIHMF